MREKHDFYSVYSIFGNRFVLCKSARRVKFRPVPSGMPECLIERKGFAAALKRARKEQAMNHKLNKP